MAAPLQKVHPNDYRFVERLLYEQKTHDTVISELQAELDAMVTVPTASVVPLGHGKTQGELTPTEASVNRRLFSLRGRYLQEEIARRRRHQKAIDEALKVVTDKERILYRLYYEQELSARECARRMGYSLSWFYEFKHQLVYKVARFLGLAGY